jgi:hypothetical protein
MAVLMIAEVSGMNEDMYAGMVGGLTPMLRGSNGFISHAGGPSSTGGWRVFEVWETKEDGDAFYEGSVKPNLPPGIDVQREYHPLHTAFAK